MTMMPGVGLDGLMASIVIGYMTITFCMALVLFTRDRDATVHIDNRGEYGGVRFGC